MNRITGPMSLHIRFLNHRRIFLFSECHCPSPPGVTSLQEYLDTIFQEGAVQSDLFLETPRFTHIPMFQPELQGLIMPTPEQFAPIAMEYSELTRIGIHYWDCLGPIKTGCDKYGRVRLHNLEFRRPYMLDPGLNYELLIVSDPEVFATQNGSAIADQLYLCPTILAAMIDGDLRTVSELFLKLYQNYPQYLPTYEYVTLLKYSGYDRLSRQFKDIPHREELKTALVAKMQTAVTLPIDVADRVGIISDLFNDAYTIGRMVRCIYLYPDSEVVWMYAGYAHIHTIENLLSTVYGAIPILDIMPKMTSPSSIQLSTEDRLVIQQMLNIT